MTINLIVSGGQTGADIAGLRAARALDIPTTGFMPKGWTTERGPKPEYAQKFGLLEWTSLTIRTEHDRT